ncbi:AAA ATPase [Pirellula staleyi DSM 6068]|uniref:AAA ATPase n=1 Tax=Pirellula staleyi (strain ATCC 27377 / DSM 6068 / ICPB 4128) TaxID=530564 RepID=D2QXK6_PIRSD|nr:AAA family ATPase [Pirellula staleyi]ADB16191.1 AAA ATPase [Pirellula staleyi DSM 6068]
MYQAYWQLAAKPFEPFGDPRFYYPSDSQQGAILKLRYAIENRRQGAVLAGGCGLGKTMLAQAILRQLSDSFAPRVQLVFPQFSTGELLAYLADQLTGSRLSSTSPAALDASLSRIETRLIENAKSQKHAVIVVDEAHLLRDTSALETIRLLMNLEYHSQPLATFILVGQTSLLLAIEQMPDLEERLAVKCLVRRFSLAETMAYVQHRLSAAGCQRAIFEDEAIESVHHLTQGIPRRINRLCDLALLVGFAEELPAISAEHIESVSTELASAIAE